MIFYVVLVLLVLFDVEFVLFPSGAVVLLVTTVLFYITAPVLLSTNELLSAVCIDASPG